MDTDDIGNVIMTELNDILDHIAPPKVVQRRSNMEVKEDDESKAIREESDKLLDEAIRGGNQEDFRHYNNIRNK